MVIFVCMLNVFTASTKIIQSFLFSAIKTNNLGLKSVLTIKTFYTAIRSKLFFHFPCHPFIKYRSRCNIHNYFFSLNVIPIGGKTKILSIASNEMNQPNISRLHSSVNQVPMMKYML